MKSLLLLALLIFLIGFLPDEDNVMPVDGAAPKDWNPLSFWYYPWGRSGVHKGIDIFAAKGTPVRATTSGIVLYSGDYGRGGKVGTIPLRDEVGLADHIYFFVPAVGLDGGRGGLLAHDAAGGGRGERGERGERETGRGESMACF